jgi:hypothetical protein
VVAGIVGIPAFLLQRAPDCHIIAMRLLGVSSVADDVFSRYRDVRDCCSWQNFMTKRGLEGYEED